jgi:2-polyprenyl-3-methyl-5-hydroxy-6-metoxy-1,4-benzoquinol methylase
MTPAQGLTTTLETPHECAPTTDPTYLFDLAEGMHAIEAVTASVGWLHLCERLATKPATEEDICRDLDLAPRPAHVLLTLLTSLGLLTRDNQGIYALTQLTREHLLPDSPWSLVPCFEALKQRPQCLSLLSVLRTGKTFGAQGGTGSESWVEEMGDEGFAERFLNAIDSRNLYLAHAVAEQLDVTGCRRLLDVGGGSGIYACALARRDAELRATVLEKPPVDVVARRAIERRGLADRVSVVSGDMFAGPLPSGYDAHLYSNVIHDWDEETVGRLLRSSWRALPPGGRVIIHDAILDEHGRGPRAVAEYSVLLMAFTAGRCYSVDEIYAFLAQAGFVHSSHFPTVVHRTVVTAVKPTASNEQRSNGKEIIHER